MTPTSMPFSGIGQLSAGLTNAVAVDPTLSLLLVAAAIVGLTYFLIRRALKAAPVATSRR